MNRAAALAAGLLLAGCAAAPSFPTVAMPVEGYLSPAEIEAVGARFFPSPVDRPSDDALFESIGPGTDRWWLAIAQAEVRPPEAAQHFDCVLDARLAQGPRPALTRLMNRLLIDSVSVSRILAGREPRRRPVAVRPDLQPCVRIDATTRDSPSWPAGAAVAGAAYGEMFAALAPDRAAAARARGRDIGMSRALCRMNWATDVSDGLEIGRAVYARAAATPAFKADLEVARAEIDAARAEGLSNPACAAERRALG